MDYRSPQREVYFVWDYDKEEKRLNEMAAKGFMLTSVGFFSYRFEDCIPDEYRICLQYLSAYPRSPESIKYIGFLEETGAEYVCSLCRLAYFRKKTSDGEF